jgi:hypothetical protein
MLSGESRSLDRMFPHELFSMFHIIRTIGSRGLMCLGYLARQEHKHGWEIRYLCNVMVKPRLPN